MSQLVEVFEKYMHNLGIEENTMNIKLIQLFFLLSPYVNNEE